MPRRPSISHCRCRSCQDRKGLPRNRRPVETNSARSRASTRRAARSTSRPGIRRSLRERHWSEWCSRARNSRSSSDPWQSHSQSLRLHRCPRRFRFQFHRRRSPSRRSPSRRLPFPHSQSSYFRRRSPLRRCCRWYLRHRLPRDERRARSSSPVPRGPRTSGDCRKGLLVSFFPALAPLPFWHCFKSYRRPQSSWSHRRFLSAANVFSTRPRCRASSCSGGARVQSPRSIHPSRN
jgi:hypothetical protein